MRDAVSIIIAAGALATACSGGADSGARDASPDGGDGSADPVLELLARPHVQDALAAAAAAGYPISTASKLDPPLVTGYYLKPNGLGQFVASGNGADLTTGVAGDESRVMVQPDGSVTIAYVSFDSSAPIGSIVTAGLLLRGANDEFTLYESYSIPCSIDGADRVIEEVGIQTGRFIATTGDWESVRRINITVAASGTQTSACDQFFAGNTEVLGGWIVADVPLFQHITVADLQYMCVDGNAGYVAGETWTRADGARCSCSTDLLVVCG